MPVRSLTSSVLRWPDAETVHHAAQAWAVALGETTPEAIAVGYFGSYARGDAGVGSDLDLVVIVRESALPFERRAVAWPLEALPVPAEALVYTLTEWQQMPRHRPRFFRVLRDETRWLIGSPPSAC
ncbi:MAG: nucleotidyltransferase domain-containing protein [Dehalococcoidia bacterium]